MQQDYKTLIIYVLTLFVVVLLIVLKKQQDHLSELENEVISDEEVELVLDSLDQIPMKEAVPKEAVTPMRGVIAIIIDDFGYRNDHISNGFLELPARLTYAIIPGHDHSQSFSKKAYDAGYEIIVHLPMENIGKTYGEEEYVLMSYFQEDEIKQRINKSFANLPEAVGLNNHQGSRGTADARAMTLLAKEINL